VVCIDLPPNTTGHETPAHKHASDQVRIIVSGTFKIGNEWLKAGDIRFQGESVLEPTKLKVRGDVLRPDHPAGRRST